MNRRSYIEPSFNARSFGESFVCQLRRLSCLLICGLLLGTNLFAGDVKFQVGAGVTTQIVPLAGLDVILGYKADESSLPLLPDHRSEFAITYHNLTGNGQVSNEGTSGVTSVTFVAYEFDYFMNFGSGDFSVGPGVGYGIAETVDSSAASGGSQLGDPSPFLTANDIHYGTLLLRVSQKWSAVACDGIANSFGGLIGGSIVCGIQF